MSEKVAGCRDKKKKASGRADASIKEWCVLYNENAAYPETAYSYDDIDQEQIRLHPNVRVVIVTNTPYEEISIPKNAQYVLVTFATSPENIKAAAAVLFGKMTPEGVWPLSVKKEAPERTEKELKNSAETR